MRVEREAVDQLGAAARVEAAAQPPEESLKPEQDLHGFAELRVAH